MLTLENPAVRLVDKGSVQLTRHALGRLHCRGFRVQAIQATLRYGRVLHVRGAAIHAIGRREVEAHKRHGVNLMQFEGIQVVCSPDDTAILTVYRNRDFRGLRPRRHSRAGWRRPAVRTSALAAPCPPEALDARPEGRKEAA